MTPNRRKADQAVNERRTVWLSIFAYGTLALLAGVFATLAFWYFAPYNVSTIYSVRVLNKTVTQGDTLAVVVTGEKHLNVAGTSHRSFQDGLVFDTPDEYASLSVGKFRHLVTVEVPRTLPPGVYKLVTTTDYQVNPIRDVTGHWETAKFVVLPKVVPPTAVVLKRLSREIDALRRQVQANKAQIKTNTARLGE